VYLGISDGRHTDVAELDLGGDRAEVRSGAVAAAVQALLARLA
jgi:nicotinamide-nucleotide amidase